MGYLKRSWKIRRNATSTALQSAPPWQIKKISGHQTNAILDRYIRDARLFNDNRLPALF